MKCWPKVSKGRHNLHLPSSVFPLTVFSINSTWGWELQASTLCKTQTIGKASIWVCTMEAFRRKGFRHKAAECEGAWDSREPLSDWWDRGVKLFGGRCSTCQGKIWSTHTHNVKCPRSFILCYVMNREATVLCFWVCPVCHRGSNPGPCYVIYLYLWGKSPAQDDYWEKHALGYILFQYWERELGPDRQKQALLGDDLSLKGVLVSPRLRLQELIS